MRPETGIPAIFYLRYWLTNCLMAAGLGFIFGAIIPSPPFPPLIKIFSGPVLALLIYQVSAYRYFWGRNRGHFEYYYREYLINQAAKSLIRKTIGVSEFFWGSPGQYYPAIFERPEVVADPDLQFIVFLKVAQAALKEDDCRKEIENLRKAVGLREDDLVANCRLAHALERAGIADKAISAYQAALTDPSLDTAELREFIAAQIERVEAQGPAKKPPMPGLRNVLA